MVVARQFISFGVIGIGATFTHLAIAWFLYSSANMHPALVNFVGACAAFFVSFYGNRSLTFKSRRPVRSSVWRYIVISILSYSLTTAIMVSTERLGLPTLFFACLVVLTIPPLTFLMGKFWAFAETSSSGD